MEQYNDPLRALLSNDKISKSSYWDKVNGSSTLGLHDSAVAALRKLGYTGTLGDMLRGFYKDLSGSSDLTTAWAKSIHIPDRVGVKNFNGKVNGDGDLSRIAKYGQSASLMLPGSFTSEVVSGYAGMATINNGTWASWSTTTPAGVRSQMCFTMDLSAFGTVADNRKFMKSLDITAIARYCTGYIFNNTTNAWVNVGSLVNGASFVTGNYQVTDKVNDYISSANKVIFGVLSTTVSDGGSISTGVHVDYYEVKATFLK